jgi:hypothetical protein
MCTNTGMVEIIRGISDEEGRWSSSHLTFSLTIRIKSGGIGNPSLSREKRTSTCISSKLHGSNGKPPIQVVVRLSTSKCHHHRSDTEPGTPEANQEDLQSPKARVSASIRKPDEGAEQIATLSSWLLFNRPTGLASESPSRPNPARPLPAGGGIEITPELRLTRRKAFWPHP